MTEPNNLNAARNAQAALNAVYQWVDRVEAAGGVTCLSGVAEAHAMMKSLKGQIKRMDSLITEPLIAAIKAAEKEKP